MVQSNEYLNSYFQKQNVIDNFHKQMGFNIPTKEEVSLTEIKEKLDEILYWVKPCTGNLITGNSAVQEYHKLLMNK